MEKTIKYDKILSREHKHKIKDAADNQEALLKLCVSRDIKLGTLPSGEPQILIDMDFDGTSISPGNCKKEDDKLGFYTESVHVRIWLQNQEREPGWQWRHGGEAIGIAYDHPDSAANAAGTTSRSYGWSFDANLGMFGKAPMATIGGGISDTTSKSRAITDFAISNNSTGDYVQHDWMMTTENYDPADPREAFSANDGDPFVGSRLKNAPELASSNFPIKSAATFQLDSKVFSGGNVRVVALIRSTFAFFEVWRVGIGNNVFEVKRDTFDVLTPLDFDWSAELQG